MNRLNAATRLTANDDKAGLISRLFQGYFGPKTVAGVEQHGNNVEVLLRKGITMDDMQWIMRSANVKSPHGLEVRPSQHSGVVTVLVDVSHTQAPQHHVSDSDDHI